MKILIIALGLLGGDPSEFCQGFRDGYAKGWCGKLALQCDPPKRVPCPAPEEWERHSYWAGHAKGEPVGKSQDQRLAEPRPRRSQASPNSS